MTKKPSGVMTDGFFIVGADSVKERKAFATIGPPLRNGGD